MPQKNRLPVLCVDEMAIKDGAPVFNSPKFKADVIVMNFEQ